MTAPSPYARLAGTPILAVLLFIGYGMVITGWFEGRVAWWWAALAFLLALKTLKALGDVRRYKAWLAQWNAMDGQEQAKPVRKRPSATRICVLIAVAMFLYPLLQPIDTPNSGLKDAAWVASALYLVFALVRFIVRRVRKGRSGAEGEGESKPVRWLIDRASSSPSREEAAQHLPDYCDGLLRSSAQREEE
jgi:hypothetical protein